MESSKVMLQIRLKIRTYIINVQNCSITGKYEGGGAPVSQKGFGSGGKEELITIMMGKRSIGHGTQVFHL